MSTSLDQVLYDLIGAKPESMRAQVWRGQSEGWPLQPGLYRRLTRHAGPAASIDEATIRAYEMDLFCEANGFGYYTDNRLSTMVSLQHHGAATRLLDVTGSSSVALWFAAQGSPTTDGILYRFEVEAQRTFHYSEKIGWETLVGPEHAGEPTLYFPDPTDVRIRAQQAGFLTTVLDKPIGHKDDFVRDDGKMTIQRVAVPGSRKSRILEALAAQRSIDAYSIYPDFAGYAMANSARSPFRRRYAELYDGRDGLFPNRPR